MNMLIQENGKHPCHIDCFAPPNEIQEAIAQRAYEIYCSRGCQEGNALDHWLQAEEEVIGLQHEIARPTQ
jgi:hypothetical protein